MSVYNTTKSLVNAISNFVLTDFLGYATANDSDIQGNDLLSVADIEKAFADNDCSFGNSPNTIYTTYVTFLASLLQMIANGTQRSYREAVQRIGELFVTCGLTCSSNTGAFASAKGKIAEGVPRDVMRLLAERAEDAAPERMLWNGRRNVFIVDGTTFDMADTPANQNVYPQPKDQADGCGYPKMRAVGLISLATGMIRDIEYASYSGKATGEMSLLRKMLDRLPAESLILGDKLYCGYFLFACLRKMGMDAAINLTTDRLNELGNTKVRQLKNGDWVIKWKRPVKPEWMSQEEYDEYDKFIELRLVETEIRRDGFRTEKLYVVTTLMDVDLYPADAIAELYDKRWHIELDFRSIKSTRGLVLMRMCVEVRDSSA